jgi:ribosome-binding ATPase
VIGWQRVHGDMERGLVAAELIGWQQLVEAGGYAQSRERALRRTEGRDYELRDGEVVTFRFTPP